MESLQLLILHHEMRRSTGKKNAPPFGRDRSTKCPIRPKHEICSDKFYPNNRRESSLGISVDEHICDETI